MANFFHRIAAYFIDAVIVTVILGFITAGIANDTSELQNRVNELQLSMTTEEEITEEFVDEYAKLLYDIEKSNVLVTSLTISVYIAYFIIFQYMFNGQTLGKKILKIMVVNKDDSKASIWQFILRYLFIMNIFSGILHILLLYVFRYREYLMSYVVTMLFDTTFIFISVLFVLYRKDKRGLHDMMAQTKVIKEV